MTTDDLAAPIARLEDVEAIRQLDARYCRLLDRLLDSGEWGALMDLFTEDGEFDGLSNPKGKPAMRAGTTIGSASPQPKGAAL